MAATCILTDSTAQFPIPAFAGRALVNIVPMVIGPYDGKPANQLRAHDFPRSAPLDFSAEVQAPSIDSFEKQFLNLAKSYSGIVAILHTTSLSQTYHNAAIAASRLEGQVEIEVIDAQTIATGLGLIVQTASQAAEGGSTVAEISELIRSMLPRVYSIFCIPSLTYLRHNGFLGQAQSIIGEHLKMLPIYVVEAGELTPTQKARNHRHLVDLLHEFITEFDTLDHLGLIQGIPPFETETRALRERLALDFETLNISEHTISPELSLMIGPHSLGMFLLQSEYE